MQMFTNMFKNNFDGYKIIMNMKQESIVCVAIGIVILLILDILTICKINIYEKFRKVPFIIRWSIYSVTMFAVIMLAGGKAQEFLYFQF